MRNWLQKLHNNKLFAIARDLGYERTSPAEAVDFVMEQAKSYNWALSDIQARYGAEKE